MTLISSISGIRGTIGGKSGEGFTPEDIVKFTSAFAQWLIINDKAKIVVIGRDGRISGQMVKNIVTGTLQSMGIKVIDLDLSTTPTVEIAVTIEKAGGGIIITASHNPKQWNALKLLNDLGRFISDKDGKQIMKIAEDRDYVYAGVDKLGTYHPNNTYIDLHIEKILKLPMVDVEAIKNRKFKIVIDCVNSTGGISVPKLLNSLGVTDLVELFCAPNGRFPHNPEPLPENLSTLSNEVKFHKADLGIAVDPDVDRLCFVCEDGSFFGEEYTLVAIADYILQHKKGAAVSNMSSTQALKDIADKHGCKYYSSAVGEVNVVNKMIETKAVIGGEGNGGVIYPEMHYGRDALCGIALFLTHLAKSKLSCLQLRSTYPNYHLSKNKINIDHSVDLDYLLEQIQKKYKNNPSDTTDGIKIFFEKDWIHLRKSNTEPIIRIYSESTSETTSQNLASKIIKDFNTIIQETKK